MPVPQLMQGPLLTGQPVVFAASGASDMLTPSRNNGLPSWAKPTGEIPILIH